MPISDFKSKVTIIRPGTPTKTAGGGLVPTTEWTFPKWAKVESRSGSMQTDSAQNEWNYDYKITVRYTPSNIEKSGDYVTYDGKTLLVRSLSYDGEGAKRLVILRCSNNE